MQGIIPLRMRMNEWNMTIMQINNTTSQERELHPWWAAMNIVQIGRRPFITICRKSLLCLVLKLQTIKASEISMRKGIADTNSLKIPMNKSIRKLNSKAMVDIHVERVVNTSALPLLVVKWLKWQMALFTKSQKSSATPDLLLNQVATMKLFKMLLPNHLKRSSTNAKMILTVSTKEKHSR